MRDVCPQLESIGTFVMPVHPFPENKRMTVMIGVPGRVFSYFQTGYFCTLTPPILLFLLPAGPSVFLFPSSAINLVQASKLINNIASALPVTVHSDLSKDIRKLLL